MNRLPLPCSSRDQRGLPCTVSPGLRQALSCLAAEAEGSVRTRTYVQDQVGCQPWFVAEKARLENSLILLNLACQARCRPLTSGPWGLPPGERRLVLPIREDPRVTETRAWGPLLPLLLPGPVMLWVLSPPDPRRRAEAPCSLRGGGGDPRPPG